MRRPQMRHNQQQHGRRESNHAGHQAECGETLWTQHGSPFRTGYFFLPPVAVGVGWGAGGVGLMRRTRLFNVSAT